MNLGLPALVSNIFNHFRISEICPVEIAQQKNVIKRPTKIADTVSNLLTLLIY